MSFAEYGARESRELENYLAMNNKKAGIVLPIIVVLLSFGMALRAQDMEFEPPVDTLDEVVVTADRIREIVPAQKLSGEQLQRLSSNSIADALRYFSGVQIKDYGGIGGLKTVNVRSLGSQHVGVFYDGIQISNAQNGTVDLGKFSMDNMEVLSVYNGQKSDIFQSARDYASAAALYMVSRRPKFSEDRENNLNFKLRSGSFDLIDLSGLWEHRIGKYFSTSVNAEFLNTSGRYKFRYQRDGGYDTTEVRRNGDVMFVRAEAGLFGQMPRPQYLCTDGSYTSGGRLLQSESAGQVCQ